MHGFWRYISLIDRLNAVLYAASDWYRSRSGMWIDLLRVRPPPQPLLLVCKITKRNIDVRFVFVAAMSLLCGALV